MKLSKLQSSRFEAAKLLFKGIILLAEMNDLQIVYTGAGTEITTDYKNIKISDNGIALVINDCSFELFNANPFDCNGQYNLGAPHSVYAAWVRSKLKLVKFYNY